jgi:hypothetical protein
LLLPLLLLLPVWSGHSCPLLLTLPLFLSFVFAFALDPRRQGVQHRGRAALQRRDKLPKLTLVIPHRAKGPVRNLLLTFGLDCTAKQKRHPVRRMAFVLVRNGAYPALRIRIP